MITAPGTIDPGQHAYNLRMFACVRVSLVAAFAIAAVSCSSPPPLQAPEPADSRAKALADDYLAGFFERYPDQATYYGVPNSRHDRLPDNSLPALTAWEAKEDAWATRAAAIDSATIAEAPLKATYAIVREAIDGSRQARLCRTELWNVSQMT